MVQVPQGWLPHVHKDKSFWIWAPAGWKKTASLSKGSCFALSSRSDVVLLEVFVLGLDERPEVAELAERAMKRSLLKDHADLQIIHEGLCRLEKADNWDALTRMAELGLVTDYDFFAYLRPASSCRRLIVEYAERVKPGPDLPTKTTTDCFFLRRGDLLLQINMKTISSQYAQLKPTFEQIAANTRLARLI